MSIRPGQRLIQGLLGWAALAILPLVARVGLPELAAPALLAWAALGLVGAAWALDESPAEAPRAVSRAKALMTEAFNRIGTDAIQLHGTLAFTDEYPVQLYYKRSKLMRPLFGDAAHHYDRLLRLRGL